jgi:hypothetical protein
VETVLGTRQKLVLLTGYIWSDDSKLFYSVRTLTSYGLLLATTDTKLYLIREKINWFTAPRNNLVAAAIVHGNHIAPCASFLGSWVTAMACNRKLGGSVAIHVRMGGSEFAEVEVVDHETPAFHNNHDEVSWMHVNS